MILHIGQHKTGSTSIQQNLESHKDDGTYFYPSIGKKHSGHHEIFTWLTKKKVEVDLMNQLIDEVVSNDLNKVILSSEYFSSNNELSYDKPSMNRLWLRLSEFSALFEKVIIVYYVREQSSSIASRINQAVKSRICLKNKSIKPFIENPTLNYLVFDDAIKYYFPHSEVIARSFNKNCLYKSDVNLDFSKIANIPEFETREVNRSITSMTAFEECIKVNNLNKGVQDKMEMKKEIISKFQGAIDDDLDILGNSKESILKQFESSNQLFLLRYPSLLL